MTDSSTTVPTSKPAVQRDRPRNSIFLGAVLRFEGDELSYDVRVRNISAGGMMVDFAAEPAEGSVVKIELRNIGVISGTVAWSSGHRMGIRFDREIDPAVARVKPVAPPVPGVPKPITKDRRPGLSLR